MIKDPDIVWNNCLTIIKKDINPQSYKTWFEPVKAVKFKDNILSIQVPNKFFYEWLEEHYVKELKKAITAEIGGDARLEYQILVDNHRKIGRNAATADQSPVPGAFESERIKNPFVIPGIKKLNIDQQLNAEYTFDTFIEGECNKLAR